MIKARAHVATIVGIFFAGSSCFVAGSVDATASPIKPLSFQGCTGSIVNVAGPGNKSTAKCTNLTGYSQIRAIAQCNSGNFVYGPWVPDNWTLSQTSTCYTGVRGTWGAGYYLEAR